MIDGKLLREIVDEVKLKIKDEICFDEEVHIITPRLIQTILHAYYKKRYVKVEWQ